MTRRDWLGSIAGAGWTAGAGAKLASAASTSRPRVACILNVYSPNSHADVFLSRMLDGYRLNGAWHPPRVRAVSMYVDQFPFNDMAREQAAEYDIRLCKTVGEAIRDVDAIAVIGEHGNYPRSPLGNFEYPRKRYFDEIATDFRGRHRTVPLFNDKYLAFRWNDAKSMYDQVHDLRIPFLCGSTLPWTWRRPNVEFAPGTQFDELLAISCGDLEEHAYHGIELLQSIAESRRGGETGIAAVRYLEGTDAENLSPALRDAALATRVNPAPADRSAKTEAFAIRYADGLTASVVNLNSKTRDYLFAAKVHGDPLPRATCFYIGLYTHSHWGFLVQAFEELAVTGREQMPAERTLLANGIMLAGLQSRKKGGVWVDTPELRISYSWPRR